jgi:hypothetical protein
MHRLGSFVAVGPPTATFTVKYVRWQKSFTCETSLEALMAQVELAWTSLKMRKYKLTLGKAEVVTDVGCNAILTVVVWCSTFCSCTLCMLKYLW